MRYLLFLPVFLFFSCSGKKQPVKTFSYSGEQVDSVRRENLRAKTDSSIILGFRFGMDRQEYDYNYSRLVRDKTLFRFSKTEYAYEIKPDSGLAAVNAQLIPTFDKNELVQLNLLTYVEDRETAQLVLNHFLDGMYGQKYLSARSLTSVWIKGGLEVDLSSKPVKTDPNLSPVNHFVITYRPTQLALLAHL